MNIRSIVFSLLLSLPLLSSCIIIPLPSSGHKVLAGEAVTAEQLSFLSLNSTTQAEVLEHLGAPDIIWEDVRVFVYNWELSDGRLLWFLAGYTVADGGIADLSSYQMLLIQFGEQQQVIRFEAAERPAYRSYGHFLEKWITEPQSSDPIGLLRKHPVTRNE
jgi:hypothetical protein